MRWPGCWPGWSRTRASCWHGCGWLVAALTIAGLDALATRSGKPVSALRGVLATLERHALLFPNLLPDTVPAQPGEPRERSWRGVSGWRIAPETRAALPRELPLQPLGPPR